MAAKKLLVALLLPLPFAALPLAALLFVPAHTAPRIEVTNATALTGFGGAHRTASSLTYGISESSNDGCLSQSIPPVQG